LLTDYDVDCYGDKRSFIFKHGSRFIHRKDKEARWLCLHCFTEFRKIKHYGAKATSGAINHLLIEHKITNPSRKRALDNTDIPDESDLPDNRRDIWITAKNVARSSFDKDTFTSLLYSWIITGDIAFRKIEDKGFRELIDYCSPLAAACLQSHQTLSRNIRALHQQGVTKVAKFLATAVTRISFSFDLWTSPNKKAMIGVVAHFVDSAGDVRSVRLALQRLLGEHSGANMAASLVGLFKSFGIDNKVGYFMCDNASSNDTCIEAMLLLLPSWCNDKAQVRLRCVGHIFNLVASAILFGQDDEAQEDLFDEYPNNLNAVLLEWRKKGPIGKLHNVIRYIRSSPQRIAEFESFQRDVDAGFDKRRILALVADVVTRWNSTSEMIDRALLLKQSIDDYSSKIIGEWHQHKRNGTPPSLVDDALTTDDWLCLTEYRGILKPLHDATKALEGHAGGRFGAIWLVLPTIEQLLNELEDKKRHCLMTIETQVRASQLDTDAESDVFWSHLTAAVNRGWKKLDDYYNTLDATPVYVAAIVLHPAFKWRWFDTQWKSKDDWISEARKSMDRLWQLYRKSKVTLQSQVDTTIVVPRGFLNFSALETNPDDIDQMAAYLADPTPREPRCEQSPIAYWTSRRTTWPELSLMALDIFAVPAMSDEPERMFSSAAGTLSSARRTMSDDTAESLIVMKSWLRQDLLRVTNEEIRQCRETQSEASTRRSPSVD
jgi:hypothetical protein